MTNKERILNHIKRYGSITTFTAFNSYGATRLSAIIFNLKKDGYKIKSEPINVKTRYGNKVIVSKYSLVK